MTLKISDLYVLVSIENGVPCVYPKIFTDEKEANEYAKALNMKVRTAFIDSH